MDLFNINLESWNIVIKINIIAFVFVIAIAILFVFLIKKYPNIIRKNSINVDEVTLGIGDSNIKMNFRKKDQEIAYKLWVELSTRKIGIPFDEEKDVIVEVYNSWYEFFKIARGLLEEIPGNRLESSNDLIKLTEKVLNQGLRPHLTSWQAKFRKWYEFNSKNDESSTPQDIQRKYPQYDELVSDLKETNKRMIYYKSLMYNIAFKR